jgi:hypothetical protein
VKHLPQQSNRTYPDGSVMATIQLDVDNVHRHIWWLKWLEPNEIIGRIVEDENGRWQIFPLGPHWSPMKSFAAYSFDSPEKALAEVELYFRHR